MPVFCLAHLPSFPSLLAPYLLSLSSFPELFLPSSWLQFLLKIWPGLKFGLVFFFQFCFSPFYSNWFNFILEFENYWYTLKFKNMKRCTQESHGPSMLYLISLFLFIFLEFDFEMFRRHMFLYSLHLIQRLTLLNFLKFVNISWKSHFMFKESILFLF